MKRLTVEEYKGYLENAKPVNSSGTLLLTPENNIVRCIRRRRKLFSSSHIWPYAKRIERNAKLLHRLGIPSLEVLATHYCPPLATYILIYPRLEGEDIKRSIERGDDSALEHLPAFIAELHRLGIYMWDLHFGNILELPGRKFALLDIASLSCRRNPLGARMRARNMAHLLRHDGESLVDYGIDTFLSEYVRYARISSNQEKRFLHFLKKYNSKVPMKYLYRRLFSKNRWSPNFLPPIGL